MIRQLVIGLISVILLVLVCANQGSEYSASSTRLAHLPPMPVNSENPLTDAGVELGRHLFYDPILSADSSISCATCHKQEFAFSSGNERLSSGIHGQSMRRNTPPLFNLAWYEGMFWDGRAGSIEAQVLHPVRSHIEMGSKWVEASQRVSRSVFYPEMFKKAFGNSAADSIAISKAIAQFLRSLISDDSKFDQALRGTYFLSKEEKLGYELINDQIKGGCLHCHVTDAHALGTTGGFAVNGLEGYTNHNTDLGQYEQSALPEDIGRFKIPSLRNIMLTAPFMHDGRLSNLDDVLDFYNEKIVLTDNLDSRIHFAAKHGLQLNSEEKECILSFLSLLTDSTFISDPAFSNPFK